MQLRRQKSANGVRGSVSDSLSGEHEATSGARRAAAGEGGPVADGHEGCVGRDGGVPAARAGKGHRRQQFQLQEARLPAHLCKDPSGG